MSRPSFPGDAELGTSPGRPLPHIEGRSNYSIARLFRLWLSMFSFSVMRALRHLFGIAFGSWGVAAIIVIPRPSRRTGRRRAGVADGAGCWCLAGRATRRLD